MKQIIIISILLGATINLYSQVGNTDSAITKQRYLLKEYALCKCLGYGFKEDSLFKQDFSLAVIVEQLDYSLEALAIVDSAMKKFANAIPKTRYADAKGKRGVMINCIDRYNSNEFDLFVKELD